MQESNFPEQPGEAQYGCQGVSPPLAGPEQIQPWVGGPGGLGQILQPEPLWF